MKNEVRNDIRQALDLLVSQEDPQFIIVYESSEEQNHVLVNGRGGSIMDMYVSIARSLYEDMKCDSLSDFLVKLAMAVVLAETEAETEAERAN